MISYRVLVSRCAALLPMMMFSALCAAQSKPIENRESPSARPGVYSGSIPVPYPTPYEPASIEDIQRTLDCSVPQDALA